MAEDFGLSTYLAPGTNLESGDPAYQGAVMQNTQRNLAPQYAQALKATRADYASRGMLDSGLEGQQEGQVRQGFTNAMGNAGEQAAIQGANLSEQERVRQEQMNFERENRDKQYDYLRQMAQNQQGQLNQGAMNGLIGGAATAVGGVGGGMLANYMTSQFNPEGGQSGYKPSASSGAKPASKDFMSDSYSPMQYPGNSSDLS